MLNNEYQKNLILRFEKYVLRCKFLCDELPKNPANIIYKDQLLRSSSSVYANYLESTCALTRRDFINDVNKARKEARESNGWINLVFKTNKTLQKRMINLLRESEEIVNILSSSVRTARGIGKK